MPDTESKAKHEDWMNSKWRPAMGWMYMAVCIFDFIIFPILWSIVQFWETSAANDAFRQWAPMTLQGSGLFHMAMGAVLGITAFGRTKEKLEGANNGGISPTPQPASFSPAPQPASFSPAPQPVVQPAPQPVAPVASSFTAAPATTYTASGKKIVPQDPDPEI